MEERKEKSILYHLNAHARVNLAVVISVIAATNNHTILVTLLLYGVASEICVQKASQEVVTKVKG